MWGPISCRFFFCPRKKIKASSPIATKARVPPTAAPATRPEEGAAEGDDVAFSGEDGVGPMGFLREKGQKGLGGVAIGAINILTCATPPFPRYY
jgi:hypothetical protein